MALTNIFQIIMFEKTSRCQTTVIFRLVSPVISHVRHLNHNQCRQHLPDELNSFMNLKFVPSARIVIQKSMTIRMNTQPTSQQYIYYVP